ncbi:MAG: glucose 1-dehydrogenase [Candidatus Latescibacteria bacterium]|jgi:2-dehydro-3-deoxy-D-gluconate 5-dehydrogenase|nr:glucose 1-dehydrogenase [Candidatus Latescibacterota bacterium]
MIKEKLNLKGKRGIITGASRGLGRGMADGLAEMGADLVITSRNMKSLEKAAGELSVYGGQVVPVQTDVGVDDDLKNLIEVTCSELGGIDFLFCNAAIIRRGAAHEHSIEDFDEIYRVNVRSVFILAQLSARVMIEQGRGGSIVITDSVVSFHGSHNVAGYSSSKGAVHVLIKTLANDWGPYNIRVNGIAPGFCETDMTEDIRKNEERYDYLTSRMALGRWGKPEDFAGAAVYFASDVSSFVTGTTLYVDGGFLSM